MVQDSIQIGQDYLESPSNCIDLQKSENSSPFAHLPRGHRYLFALTLNLLPSRSFALSLRSFIIEIFSTSASVESLVNLSLLPHLLKRSRESGYCGHKLQILRRTKHILICIKVCQIATVLGTYRESRSNGPGLSVVPRTQKCATAGHIFED